MACDRSARRGRPGCRSPRGRRAAALWLAAAALLGGVARVGAQPEPAPTEPTELRLVIGHWCPFVCAESPERTGFVTEIAQAIFREQGVPVTLVSATYTRAIEMLRRGAANAMVATREDAPDLVYPTVEQGISRNTFFVKAGNPWRYEGVSSFEQLGRVGIVQSYDYGELNESIARSRSKVDEAAGDKLVWRSIQKLLAGRFDAFIYDAVVTEYELRRMGKAAEVVAAGSLRDASPVYICFSPVWPQWAARQSERVDRGTRRLRSSGELAKILARYGMTDWQEPR